MGKRVEKAFGRDKGQASAGSQELEDDPNKPPEPHVCTGHFASDFTELCKRANMVVIPPVVPRPHRPASPPPVAVDEPKAGKAGKGADKKKQAETVPEPEPEPELDENGEPPEPPPKTYTTKDKFEFFKPCVQVEMENKDKEDTVTELFIRGWKIDDTMMSIFKECWPKMEKLQAINLWHTGLTDESIETLAAFLPECPNLRLLNLDNNPVKGQNYHLLIKDESPVQHLSLRYNSISDTGAKLLGRNLGTMEYQNQKLISLNLNGNQITDSGACALADGLRMNRNLLSLSLANNRISDAGAKKLAEVLSRFPLSHEEIVARRKLMSGRDPSDRKSISPPPGSRRAESRDRPGSVRSSHGPGTKGGKSAKAKKDTKGKEEKDPKAKTKEAEKSKKAESRASKGATNTSGRNSGASMVNDAKGGTKKDGKTKGKGGKSSQPEIESDSPELLNPLTDSVEQLQDGTVVLVGNRTLLNLNLSCNDIGEDGLKALLLAIGYQTTLNQFSPNKTINQGLMRLLVHKNKVAKDNETLQKLNAQMVTKDPFYKPPPTSPDAESQVSKA